MQTRPRVVCEPVLFVLFYLERILKLDCLRLGGLTGSHDEFLLAATVQNLRRMAKKLVPMPNKGDALIV